jgi:hypothetical protein
VSLSIANSRSTSRARKGTGVRFIAVSQTLASTPRTLQQAHADHSRGRGRVRAGDYPGAHFGWCARRQGRGKDDGKTPARLPGDEVLRLRAEGQSWRAIAKALDLPVSTARGVTACEGSIGFEVQFPNVPDSYAGRSSLLRCLESA